MTAFEMWTWRRMIKIPWTMNTTNKDVLKLMKNKKRMVTIIQTRKLKCFGHILRQSSLNHCSKGRWMAGEDGEDQEQHGLLYIRHRLDRFQVRICSLNKLWSWQVETHCIQPWTEGRNKWLIEMKFCIIIILVNNICSITLFLIDTS